MNDKKAKEERERKKRNNAGKVLAITQGGEPQLPPKSTRNGSKKPLAITAGGEDATLLHNNKKKDGSKSSKRPKSLHPEKSAERI